MIAGSGVSLATSQTATVVGDVLPVHAALWACAAALLIALCDRRRVHRGCRAPSSATGTPNPIVLTIAAGFAIGGAATWFSGGTTVYPAARGFDVLNATPLGLPLAVYVLLAVTVLVQWMLRGPRRRQMYLVG